MTGKRNLPASVAARLRCGPLPGGRNWTCPKTPAASSLRCWARSFSQSSRIFVRGRHAKEYGRQEVPGDERSAGQEGGDGPTDPKRRYRLAELIPMPEKKR